MVANAADSPLGDYSSPNERRRQTLEVAEAAHGEVIEFGHSVEGRPLEAVRIPSRLAPAPARVLCAANIHGQEFIGSRVALGLVRALAAGDGLSALLLDRAEVWVVPCLNPDGYARTYERGGVGRVVEFRGNAHGVDLNRNFPLPNGAKPSSLPGAGSHRPGAITYRGSGPLSEPETRHLDELMSIQRFHAVVGLHCFMGTLIPARTTDPAEFRAYGHLCGQFAIAQPRWKYWRLASRFVDVFTGELEDHAHHAHRAWATCVEVFPLFHSFKQYWRAPSVFWRFNPRKAQPYVDNDVPGIIAFFLRALDTPRPGFGTAF